MAQDKIPYCKTIEVYKSKTYPMIFIKYTEENKGIYSQLEAKYLHIVQLLLKVPALRQKF